MSAMVFVQGFVTVTLAMMTMSLSDGVEANEPSMIKGSIWRGLSKVLAADGLDRKLYAQLPPHVVERLVHPPVSSAWTPAVDMFPLMEAIYAEGGEAMCRSVQRRAAEVEMFVFMQTLLSSTLRLFGATPHTLFSRMNELIKSSVKGQRVTYVKTGERSGTLTMGMPSVNVVPMAMYYASFGSSELAFSLTRTTGHLLDVAYVPGKRNVATAHASWR